MPLKLLDTRKFALRKLADSWLSVGKVLASWSFIGWSAALSNE